MRKLSRNLIYNLLSIENKNSNYGPWKGSLNFWNLMLWNILFPGRLIHRFRGNNLFKFNLKKNSADFQKECKNIKLFKKLEVFYRDGAVIIDNFFSKELIEEFKSTHSSDIIKLRDENNQNNPVTKKSLVLSDILVKFWLDNDLMLFLQKFYQKKFYARSYPQIYFHANLKYSTSKEKFKNSASILTDNWHVDHANLVNMHVLLEDVKENDMCMEYIPKSHNYFNMTNIYSDEEVSNLDKPIKCIGQKGTVYFHYGNTLHRLLPIENSNRLQFHFEFTSAENILFNCYEVKNALLNNFKLDSLKSSNRDILSGLFPKSLNKGFNIKNGVLVPSSEKVI